MRKTLEAAAILAIVYLCGITWVALYGPERVPDRVPSHFDLSGYPDGWSPPHFLLLLPGIAIAFYGVLTLVSLFSKSFHYTVPVTEQSRAVMEGITLRMLGWLKLELTIFLATVQYTTIEVARDSEQREHFLVWDVPVFALVVFITIGWHMAAMFRTTRAEASAIRP